MSLVPAIRKPAARSPSNADARLLSALARRMGLRRAGMDVVRELADASGAPAIALLVSEHAFIVAAAELERAAMLNRTPLTDARRAAIASARHRIFGEP